jgi:hypothetical protein
MKKINGDGICGDWGEWAHFFLLVVCWMGLEKLEDTNNAKYKIIL